MSAVGAVADVGVAVGAELSRAQAEQQPVSLAQARDRAQKRRVVRSHKVKIDSRAKRVQGEVAVAAVAVVVGKVQRQARRSQAPRSKPEYPAEETAKF